jgi:hypothetical protein
MAVAQLPRVPWPMQPIAQTDFRASYGIGSARATEELAR